jgi:hypothetical protein
MSSGIVELDSILAVRCEKLRSEELTPNLRFHFLEIFLLLCYALLFFIFLMKKKNAATKKRIIVLIGVKAQRALYPR